MHPERCKGDRLSRRVLIAMDDRAPIQPDRKVEASGAFVRRIAALGRQAVARAADRLDELDRLRILDFPPQVPNILINHIRPVVDVIAPHLIRDHRAGQDLAGRTYQTLQERELLRGQVNCRVAALHLPRARVEREVGYLQHRLFGLISRAARDRPQARDQLLDGERLDQIVIGARSKPVDLSTLLRDVAESLVPLAEAKGLAMACDVPERLIVLGDSDGLIRLFVNLLDNAVQYTDEGGVTIRTETVSGMAQVAIADTGIGITAQHLPRLFDRFYRVDRARLGGGSGLGLAIAQEIAGAHGGRILVRSTVGVGTTFVVELPQSA